MIQVEDIHVDHVGSLLRPEGLREARFRLLGVHDGDHNLEAHHNAELRKIEDDYVRDVVKLQEDAGLPFVTDGEFRRRSWWSDFMLSLSNTKVTYNGKLPIFLTNAKGETRPMNNVVITGKVAWQESVLAAPFKFLQSVTTHTPKVAIPGPPMLHFQRDEPFVPGIYPSMDAFWHDVIAAYQNEVQALYDAGCRYLQIDECMLAMMCDQRHREYVTSKRNEDPAEIVKMYAWSINEAISKRPKDMIVGLHVCRGNMNAFWGADGGYEPIADAMFNHIDAQVYLLEFDTARAGDFTPLRHAGKGKQVLLGLVSSKERVLEDEDMLMRRIEEAGKSLDHDQLGLCPQCGFSTNVHGTHFTVDDEKRKLELIVNVAEKAWH